MEKIIFDPKLVGSRIKASRKLSGYTQRTLAEAISLSRTSVANYELGLTVPPPKTLFKISNLCGTSTDYLLGKTNKR